MSINRGSVSTAILLVALAACKPQTSQSTSTERVAPLPGPAAGAQAAPPAATSLERSYAKDDAQSEPGVGEKRGDRVVSLGKAGFLIFGPYSPLKAGVYTVVIHGKAPTLPPDTRIAADVVSNGGSVILASQEMKSARPEDGVLFEFDAGLPEDKTDVEVRVNIPAGARVEITGYTLDPKG